MPYRDHIYFISKAIQYTINFHCWCKFHVKGDYWAFCKWTFFCHVVWKSHTHYYTVCPSIIDRNFLAHFIHACACVPCDPITFLQFIHEWSFVISIQYSLFDQMDKHQINEPYWPPGWTLSASIKITLHKNPPGPNSASRKWSKWNKLSYPILMFIHLENIIINNVSLSKTRYIILALTEKGRRCLHTEIWNKYSKLSIKY